MAHHPEILLIPGDQYRDLLLSAIFSNMTHIISFIRKYHDENQGVSFRFEFYQIWETTFFDIDGFVDPEYCFHGSLLLYVEDPSKDPLTDLFGKKEAPTQYQDWLPCARFSSDFPWYIAVVKLSLIVWLRNNFSVSGHRREEGEEMEMDYPEGEMEMDFPS